MGLFWEVTIWKDESNETEGYLIFPTIMDSPFISNSKDKCPNIITDIIDSKLSKNGI